MGESSLFAASALSFAAQERLVSLFNHNMKAKTKNHLNTICAFEFYVMVRPFAMLPAPTGIMLELFSSSALSVCDVVIREIKDCYVIYEIVNDCMKKDIKMDRNRPDRLNCLLVMKIIPAQKSLRSLQHYL